MPEPIAIVTRDADGVRLRVWDHPTDPDRSLSYVLGDGDTATDERDAHLRELARQQEQEGWPTGWQRMRPTRDAAQQWAAFLL